MCASNLSKNLTCESISRQVLVHSCAYIRTNLLWFFCSCFLLQRIEAASVRHKYSCLTLSRALICRSVIISKLRTWPRLESECRCAQESSYPGYSPAQVSCGSKSDKNTYQFGFNLCDSFAQSSALLVLPQFVARDVLEWIFGVKLVRAQTCHISLKTGLNWLYEH